MQPTYSIYNTPFTNKTQHPEHIQFQNDLDKMVSNFAQSALTNSEEEKAELLTALTQKIPRIEHLVNLKELNPDDAKELIQFVLAVNKLFEQPNADQVDLGAVTF